MEKLGILILAGGKSERFGLNKAFFRIKGKPMIWHVFERIAELSGEVVISCKNGEERFLKMFSGVKVIKDTLQERGPLIGLLSSLPYIRSEYVAVVTCDCPRISPLVVKSLFDHAYGHDGAIPVWPNGYLEPLQAVYKRLGLQSVVKRLHEKGEMKIHKVLKTFQDIVYLPVEELKAVDPKLESFLNINYPKDVELLTR